LRGVAEGEEGEVESDGAVEEQVEAGGVMIRIRRRRRRTPRWRRNRDTDAGGCGGGEVMITITQTMIAALRIMIDFMFTKSIMILFHHEIFPSPGTRWRRRPVRVWR
jgi:hypothetical protein